MPYGWFSSTAETIAEIMDMYFEAEWNCMSNYESRVCSSDISGQKHGNSASGGAGIFSHSLSHSFRLRDSTWKRYPNDTNEHPQTLSIEWDLRRSRCTWSLAPTLLYTQEDKGFVNL